MKIFDKSIFRQSMRAGLLLIIVAAVTLEATSLIQFFYAQKGLRSEATLRAETELESTNNRILDIINQAETAVHNSEWIAKWCLDYPDSLVRVATRLVRDNQVIMGSTVALVPGYLDGHQLFAPYAYEDTDGGLAITSLATPEYDYPEREWFRKPLELGTGYWSEPYVDTGGAGILMTTYSMPVRDDSGNIAAILTADISLDWLTGVVGDVKVYPSAFSVLLSRQGELMVSPTDSLVMTHTSQELISGFEDTTMQRINRAMLSGGSGSEPLKFGGKMHQIYFAPIEKTGWSMSIVIPEDEIYKGLRKTIGWVSLFQLLGLAMLAVILFAIYRSVLKYKDLNDRKERMDNELRIGHSIQMSMVPKIFPPFPDRKDLDISAALVPAREVGGDLYDFYIRDEKLFFCIGDVSGKGIPASLVMAVTRSLFRSISGHENSPGAIVSIMNQSMSSDNDNSMFVTFFCGVLDLASGHLRYCNAGHNAPFIFTDSIRTLPVVPNLPLGVDKSMTYQEQETDLLFDNALFLFTDGVYEAENSQKELFGEKRIREVLSTRRDAQAHLEAINKAVEAFVGDAPQSDDITMLFLHYLNFHLSLRNEVSQISRLAPFISKIAKVKHLDSTLASSLNLALEEAVTNSVMYAYPEGTEGIVDVKAILNEDSIQFVISDKGIPFDPTAAPAVDTSLGVEERAIGGLGIHLVRKIMDNVSYRRDGSRNILSMTKKI